MAGLGVQLNRIFDKHSVAASLYGIGFSFIYTIAPMIIVMGCLLAMFWALGFDQVGYLERETFSVSILYIFIFSLLSSSPFHSVLLKYQSDRVYEQRYEDIRPCIYVGTVMNLTFSSLLAIPFYSYELLLGQVDVSYVFTTYLCYLGLTLTISTMVYNSLLKQYKKITVYFLYGMSFTFAISLLFYFFFRFTVTFSMLLAMTLGFLLIAALELANVLRYFPANSGRYREVVLFLRSHWKLLASNFLYTFGLFAHNFVFWAQPGHLVVRNTYVCNQSYDMASCLAMFTNISASVLFISRVEMHFQDRYKDYTQAVIGGKLDNIEKAKDRMFRGLSSQMLSLTYLQFIVSVILFLLAIILLPILGFSGMIMDIYPQLAVGYFISFLMYSEMLFLYYFDDLTGVVINGLIFASISFGASLPAAHLPHIWYGAGFTAASFMAFTFSYYRLRWIEKNIDTHVFCRGRVLKQVKAERPPADVFHKYRRNTESTNN